MAQKKLKDKVLLLEDVFGLGKKGQIASARLGYVRNFLVPQNLAVKATQNMLRKQESLVAQREIQSVEDRKLSETMKAALEAVELVINAKVDPDGRMYGSVTAGDVAQYFVDKGFADITRVNVHAIDHTMKSRQMKAIKEIGTHKIVLNLKEGIQAFCELTILPEGEVKGAGMEKVVKAVVLEDETESEE
jgi:large subunit ribosomal protein L9